MGKRDKKKQNQAVDLNQPTKIISWAYAEKIEKIIELKLTLEILGNHTNEHMTKTASYMFLATVIGYLVEKAPLFEERKLPPMQMEFYSIIFAAACGGIYWYWRKSQIPDIIADGFDSLDVYDPNILDNRIKMLLSENNAQMNTRDLVSNINLISISILLLIAFFSCIDGKISSAICIALPLLFLHLFLNRDGALKRLLYDENTINLITVQNTLTTQHQEITTLLEEIGSNNPFLKINTQAFEGDLDQRNHQSISLSNKRICCTLQLHGKYRNLDIKYVNKELCYMLSLINILSYPNFYANRKKPGITIMTTSAFSKKSPILDKNSLAEILKQRLDFLCDVKHAEVSISALLTAIDRRFGGDWHWSYLNDEKYQLALCFSVLLYSPTDKDLVENFFKTSCRVNFEDDFQCNIICYDMTTLIKLLGLNQKKPYRPSTSTSLAVSSSSCSTSEAPMEPYLKSRPKSKTHASQSNSNLSLTTTQQKTLGRPPEANPNLSSIAANLGVEDKDGIRIHKLNDSNRFFYLPNSELQAMDATLNNKKASEKMRLILGKGNCLSSGDRGTQGIKIYPTEKEGVTKFNLVLKPKAAFGSLRIWFTQHSIVKEGSATKYEMSFQKIKRK